MYDDTDKVLFSGDTLFKGTIGRTDLDGGDLDKLMESLWRVIIPLVLDVQVFPGHGLPTSIYEELKNNPFLSRV